jgi:uncharacterized membrane protein YeaQ/YmgE (transglycosylase-associated protein family)
MVPLQSSHNGQAPEGGRQDHGFHRLDHRGDCRWLAGVVTRSNRSIWGDLVLCLAGALIAGLVTDGLVGGDSGLITSIIVAAIFAAILVLLKNFIMNRGKR